MGALTGTWPTKTKLAGGNKPGVADQENLTVTGSRHGLHKLCV